jgi:hypothetical protein
MKRILLPVALAAGLLTGIGPAIAEPPTPNDPTPYQYDCPGFVVDAQQTGKSKFISLPWGNRPFTHPVKVFIGTGPGATVTLTGPGPASKVVSYVVSGSVTMKFNPSGDIRMTATGKNLIEVPIGSGSPGLFFTVGRVDWDLNAPTDANGGLTGPGSVTDVCALLAP